MLLDTHLPGMDPLALGEELRHGKETLYTPIIYMTSLNDTENRAEELELGDDLPSTATDSSKR